MIRHNPAIILYAQTQHQHQLYGEGLPYFFHLTQVVEVLRSVLPMVDSKYHEYLQAIAWCHDVLEDTGTSYNDLLKVFQTSFRDPSFATAAAEGVYALTNEIGRNRKERHEKTYPKLRAASPFVLAVKLCDRYANTLFSASTGSASTGSRMSGLYRKELEEFLEAVVTKEALQLDIVEVLIRKLRSAM